ncbi:MAG: hypothetical protein JWM07_944 [Candidatus Saccharibacteria bacterium]|jgi:hypothetical protein|nr:hypothetical protein [Candidatus Saccharibacteria bacterium]
MDSKQESLQWHEIALQHSNMISTIDRSTTAGIDALVNEFRHAAGDAQRHSPEEKGAILDYVSSTEVAHAIADVNASLLFRGHGLYYPDDPNEPELFDRIGGISGRIGSICMGDFLSYFDLVNRRKKVLRPILCVALNGYLLHNKDETRNDYVNATVIIPLMNQDLCITSESYQR